METVRKQPTLDTWAKTFSQEGDCCGGDEVQELSVSAHDGGGGPFFVIGTVRWAIDDITQLVELLEKAGVPHKNS